MSSRLAFAASLGRGRGCPYPLFGLTSLLDAEPPRLPGGIEATASGIDLDGLPIAASACATLLRTSAAAARERIGAEQGESPMAAWVSERLRYRGTLDTVRSR